MHKLSNIITTARPSIPRVNYALEVFPFDEYEQSAWEFLPELIQHLLIRSICKENPAIANRLEQVSQNNNLVFIVPIIDSQGRLVSYFPARDIEYLLLFMHDKRIHSTEVILFDDSEKLIDFTQNRFEDILDLELRFKEPFSIQDKTIALLSLNVESNLILTYLAKLTSSFISQVSWLIELIDFYRRSPGARARELKEDLDKILHNFEA
ncbi:MAG: hypothetical protein JNK26_05275 [Candidatus Doudnabacteria bacterium]|nr:hypothetical protein [Candidatus Doudnabacteria bacterium]